MTPGVSVLVDDGVARRGSVPPPAGSTNRCGSAGGGELQQDEVVEEGLFEAPSFPPLWNAWWCGGCRALHFVADGGTLSGGCSICGDDDPVRNDVMLDPDQVAHLKETPGLSYDVLFPGDAGISQKTSGMSKSDVLASSSLGALDVENDDDVFIAMDLEVSKYPFIERLHHYMERNPIGESNRKSVKVAIMVEAGSIVRKMGTMTKERRETVFYQEYLNIISGQLE